MPELQEGQKVHEPFQVDTKALYELGKYPQAEALLAWVEHKATAAWRKLDDRHVADWQDIGFYRGQVYLCKELRKLITENPNKE